MEVLETLRHRFGGGALESLNTLDSHNMKFKSFASLTRTAFVAASRRVGGRLTGC